MKITLKILENVESEKDEEYENQEEKQLFDYYKQLNCDIRCIQRNETIYNILDKYLTAKISREDYDKFGYCHGERIN